MKEIIKKISRISNRLENTADNVLNLSSGNASRDAALYRSMITDIKDNMIPEALGLCSSNNVDIKETLENVGKSLNEVDTMLLRINECMSQSTIRCISNSIKENANKLKKICIILIKKKS